MANHYIKNCKYAKGSQNWFTDTVSDQYNLVTGFWGKKIDSASQAISSTVSGSPVKTGTDGWAKYFWDTKNKIITYVKNSGGSKVTVKPSNSAYDHLVKNIKWADSTPSAMSSQQGRPAPVTTTALAPITETPSWLKEEKGIIGKSVDYAKENPLIVGGTAMGLIAIPVLISMLSRSGDVVAGQMIPAGSGNNPTFFYEIVGDQVMVKPHSGHHSFDDIGKRVFFTEQEAYQAGMNHLASLGSQNLF
jgi:hypothetical protein